jgi:hypothetical protein
MVAGVTGHVLEVEEIIALLEPAELIRALPGGDQGAGGCHTLPGAVELDPGIDEALAVDVRFAFFGALHAQRSNDYGHIPVHLHLALFRDGLRGLVVRRLNAGQELSLGGNAAVDIDGDEGVRKKHVQSFSVLSLQGVIPGIFKGKNQPSIVVGAFLLLRACDGDDD